MDKFGFKPSTIGRDNGVYVFMGKGIPDKKAQPIFLDPNIQVAKDKGAIPSSTLDVNPNVIKNGQIFTTPKDVPSFPKYFDKTKFYKDAVRDGWIFIDRKDLSTLPPGTKVKAFKTIEKLKDKDFNKYIKQYDI